MTEGPRVLTGTALERTRAVVEEVLTKAAKDGERGASFARLILGGLMALSWPLATWSEMQQGELSDWFVVGVSAAAACVSIGILWRTKRSAMTPALRTTSIVVDVVLVIGVLGVFVYHPPPTYLGIGRMSGTAVIYFAILGAGMRLSRRGALISFVLMAIGLGGLVWADEHFNHIGDTLANQITMAAWLIMSAIFAGQLSTRTRALVLEGAEHALLAERARSRLGSYVSEEVAAHALAADDMRIGGVRQPVAILFSDLRNFTSLSENADPEQLVRELNEYFDVMVAAIAAHGGVIDKYIGDSIMAVFGAPTARPDDAARAVRAAFAMEQALAKLNASRGVRGWGPLKHGVGVHFGDCIAGNIGTTTRAQYTVIGDTVNVAARLESSTKEMGVPVLLSDAIVSHVAATPGMPALVAVGPVKVKGRDQPITVHTFAHDPALVVTAALTPASTAAPADSPGPSSTR